MFTKFFCNRNLSPVHYTNYYDYCTSPNTFWRFKFMIERHHAHLLFNFCLPNQPLTVTLDLEDNKVLTVALKTSTVVDRNRGRGLQWTVFVCDISIRNLYTIISVIWWKHSFHYSHQSKRQLLHTRKMISYISQLIHRPCVYKNNYPHENVNVLWSNHQTSLNKLYG